MIESGVVERVTFHWSRWLLSFPVVEGDPARVCRRKSPYCRSPRHLGFPLLTKTNPNAGPGGPQSTIRSASSLDRVFIYAVLRLLGPTSPPSPHFGWYTLHRKTMGRHCENTSAFFTRLTYRLRGKQLPAVVPLSKSLGPPAPQTSLSTISCIGPFDRILIHSIPFHSLRTPRRAYPLHPLPHLPGPTVRRSPCAIPHSVLDGDPRLPPPARAVPANFEHDM